MNNIKARLQRLTDAQKMNREAQVICVRRSGKKDVMNWLDAIGAAIRQDPSIDHFEDAAGFTMCADLPNVILGV